MDIPHLLIYLSVARQMYYFHFGTIRNNAALKICVQAF